MYSENALACSQMNLPQVQESSQLIRWASSALASRRPFRPRTNRRSQYDLRRRLGRNPDRVQAFAEEFSIPHRSASLDEFLATNIDAVYVATHPDTHATLCIQALTAGKHVLCEKPSALNLHQLEQILKAASQHDRLFMEAMKPPFFPLYQRLRRHLAPTPLAHRLRPRRPLRLEPLSRLPLHFPELGGGGIMGIGPYEAFLALDCSAPDARPHPRPAQPRRCRLLRLIHTEHERGMAQLHTGFDLLSHGTPCSPRARLRPNARQLVEPHARHHPLSRSPHR